MNAENLCPQCGAELAANAPRGLCPACLLKGALDSESSATIATEAGGRADFVPPTPAELARSFPDLEILELIGRGGMGIVYKARQKHLDRLVALKILLPKIARDPAFAERFAREARALAILNHPHIVTVYDFGRKAALSTGDNDAGQQPVHEQGEIYYFLMEFVDGLTLRQLLDAGKLAPQEALAIVPQICEALQYAHDKGVVHRDIKPENILLDRNARVKIADFGLAKLVGEQAQDPRITGTDQVMGTPHYMAPEQIEHPQEVDHRADIYSLGVVFYQMLTGELPIGRFAPPSRKVQVDVRLDEVVLRALEKEPALRFQQASHVKSELETIASTAKPNAEPFRVRATTGIMTTPEQLGTLRQQVGGLLATRGPLALEEHRLTHSSYDTETIIPLAAIRDVSVGYLPRAVNPARLQVVCVTYEAAGKTERVLLAPAPSIFAAPSTWNARVNEWCVAIRDAVERSTGKRPTLTPADQLNLPSSSPVLVFLTLALIGSMVPALAAVRWPSPWLIALLPAGTLTVILCFVFFIMWPRSKAGNSASAKLAAELGAGAKQPSAEPANEPADEPHHAAPTFALAGESFSHQHARQLVQGPAIGLVITGVLSGIVGAVIVFVLAYKVLSFRSVMLLCAQVRVVEHPSAMFFIAPLAIFLLANLAFSAFEIYAAIKMMRLESYRLAIAASILAIIVSPTNLIGLAIGIWSLIVLSRADVWAAFAEREGRKDPPRPATPTERRIGMAALALGLGAFPLSLVLGMSGAWKTVILAFFLVELVALTFGILGRKSVLGKVGFCLAAMIILPGTLLMARFVAQLRQDFGGMPTLERLDSRAGEAHQGPSLRPKIEPVAPPVPEPARAVSVITKPRLQFRLEATENDAQAETLLFDGRTIRLEKKIWLDESDVAAAKQSEPPDGRSVIELRFSTAGAKKFGNLTETNIARKLAILFDGRVLVAPQIRSRIEDAAHISGTFDDADVQTILDAIQAAQPKTVGLPVKELSDEPGVSD
jgi:serine/threonine protein kinase